jgi:PKD repeat protein
MQFAVTANAAGTPLQFGFRDDYSYLALDDIRVISPAIQFTASPTNGLLPLTVHFHCPPVDSASNAIASWRWSFGDGSTSPWEDPVHTYTNAGNFLPACIVTNSAGLAIAASGPAICVQPPPTVHFTASPLIGAAPLPVQFTCPALDSNGNAISAWRWDFGDGSTSTAQNPLHTYANPGMFSPALVATNSNQARVAASGPTIAVASRSGLVTNGDFETGNFFAWTSGGATSYASVSSASQFVHSGNYGAELAGTYGFVNTLSQNLATTPGANYLLSFWLNNPAGNSPNQLLVSWGGNTVWGVTNLNATGWTNVQLSVTAGATSSALQFVFEPVLYFGLDDVSVAPATPPRPGIASMAFSPASSSVNLILSGTNGQSGATYCILMTTNLANLLSQWTPVATNALATGGNFTLTATNAFDPRAPQRFYILQAR